MATQMGSTNKPLSGWTLALQILLFIVVLPVALILLLEWVFGLI